MFINLKHCVYIVTCLVIRLVKLIFLCQTKICLSVFAFKEQSNTFHFSQGTYSLKMKMLDGQKKELTCIKFSFDVGFGSSVADI